MATATVTGVDVYSWMTPVEGTIPTRYQHSTAQRGDVIDVTDDELKRGVDMGALTAGDVDVAEDDEGTGGTLGGDLTDEELMELDAPELVAWLGQNPDEATRVGELEQGRSKPRVTVLRAAGVEV